MKYGQIILSEKDHELLQLILLNWNKTSELHASNYSLLVKELARVKILSENMIPTDVVRFNSKVNIETPFGVLENYELVVPAKRDPSNRKMSILSPVGSAVIGYAEGDEVLWNFPIGKRKIKITKVSNADSSEVSHG